MYPGRLVQTGSHDDDIIVADNAVGNDIIGWLGYEQTAPAFRPSTPDTIYEADDMAAVLNGGGFIIVACLAVSQTITKGEALTSSATAGQVTTSDLTAENVVAYAEESVATGGAAVADIMVRSVI